MSNLESQIRNLPTEPGVYLFRDAAGNVLYVGKAADLRRRVLSYLSDSSHKAVQLRRQAAGVESYLTGTEVDALLLEHSLIKKHRPRYNIELKDDKTYPFVELTLDDEVPGVYFSRRTDRPKARYFGPYPSAGAVRRIIGIVEKFFRLRTCRADFDRRTRPCLKHGIGRCSAPCVGLVDADVYQESVRQAALFLDGRYDELERQLRRDMERFSDNLAFERAAELRDLLMEIRSFKARRLVVVKDRDPIDVVGVAAGGGDAVVLVLHFRNGRLVDRSEYRFVDDPDLVPRFLEQYIGRLRAPLSRLLVPAGTGVDMDLLSAYHRHRFNRGLRVHTPVRGRYVRILGMADENAAQALISVSAGRKELLALQRLLRLDRLPERIDCVDISHLGGTAMVGAVVRFERGRPDKRHYRRFRIQHAGGVDDYRSIYEVMCRCYRRLLNENGPLPDLVVVDGGKGQLGSALQAVRDIGAAGRFTLVSLAKKEETVFSEQLPGGLVLDFHRPEARLLTRIRDEAHRFAIHYNRQVRQRTLTPGLTDVPGIGPVKARRLLARFGSQEAVIRASDAELREVLSVRDIAALRERFGAPE